MRKVKAKPKSKVNQPPVDDMYKDMNPELARICREQNAKPLDMDRKRAKFLLQDKTWEGFEEFIQKLRDCDSANGAHSE